MSSPFRRYTVPGPGAWLLLDAAWPVAATGVWENGAWRSYVRTEGPVVESLFGAVERALADARIALPELAGYVYATGPGSILGLRSAAMALGAWRAAPGLVKKPVLAYDSLHIASRLARADGSTAATVFAAARRDRWNALPPGGEVPLECDANALAGMPKPLLRLPARDFAKTPVEADAFDPVDALGRHPEILTTPELLFETETPDAANIANTYVAWSGERHKA